MLPVLMTVGVIKAGHLYVTLSQGLRSPYTQLVCALRIHVHSRSIHTY
jgi:hypothetical protein